MMARATVLALLKALMISVFASWVALWILKPTEMWTRKWKGAEDSARGTVFGYYGITLLAFTSNLEARVIAESSLFHFNTVVHRVRLLVLGSKIEATPIISYQQKHKQRASRIDHTCKSL